MTDTFTSPAPIKPATPQRDRWRTAQLQGPTDADAFRELEGRQRMYIDPLPACPMAPATDANWPSISAVKKADDSDWTSTMVKRMSKLPAEEWHRIAELPYDGRRDAMWSVNRQDLNIAAGRGTIVHAWAEDMLTGRPLRKWTRDAMDAAGIPHASLPLAETYREALIDFFLTYDPELVATEYVAIHRDLNGRGYGGTPDGIWRLRKTRPGVFAFDYKTRGADARHSVYPEEARQVAAGVRAQYMIVDDGKGGAKRTAFPDLDGGVVVTIKPDGARVFPIDLDSAMDGFTKLHRWWLDKRDERGPIGRVWPLQRATTDQRAAIVVEEMAGPAPVLDTPIPGDWAGLIDNATTVDALSEVWKSATAAGQWTSELEARGLARREAIVG
jgi:hypothetical protein